jgi:chondroitin polymerizing factor
MDIVNVAVSRLSSHDHIHYSYRHIVNGYRRFDAARGTDYIIDLNLVAHVNKTYREVVRRVELVRPLGAVEIVPTPYVTENTRVHLILPVTLNERDAVLAFLDSYSRVCVDAGDNADLLLVLVYPDQVDVASEVDAYAVIKSTVSFYESRFKQRSDARISWMSVHANSAVSAYEAMMLSFSVMDIVLHRFSPESLMFLCSVGMELSVELLNRVRMNTINGFQVNIVSDLGMLFQTLVQFELSRKNAVNCSPN